MQLKCYLRSFLLLHLGILLIKGDFNDCQTKLTCGDCIKSLTPQCAWCDDIYYNTTAKNHHKKCDLDVNHVLQNCQKITNPQSTSTIDKSAKLEGQTRVSPQAVTVKLRPGQSAKVDVRIKTPKNFPIDLYYLMDMSQSMRDDLIKITNLGERLVKELQNITENFRLGFGGFVDKPVGPYTKFEKGEVEKLLNDTRKKYPVQNTFSFKNYLPLDNNKTKFGTTLETIEISYNIDNPEASLEALLQVVVCQKEIGWRGKKNARRIVIISTDDTFHYAGDGLLGGFVMPNDGKCHLNGKRDYSAWDKFDYPSLSQIRAIMIEEQIIPIFASAGKYELYDKVVDFFGPASGAVADKLKNDSTNIVPLIKEAYLKIAKIVNIKSTNPKGVYVDYTAECEPGVLQKHRDFCDNVAIDKEVTFKVDVSIKDCKDFEKGKKIDFLIKANFDDVHVTLELICDCPCDSSPDNTEINSAHCTSRGDLTCGMCFCDPTKYAGRFCQCTLEEASNQEACKIGKDDEVCSGRGNCECGECVCHKGGLSDFDEINHIYGDQCECINTTCGRSNNGQLCGGPERGKCDCNKCTCNPNWQGAACGKKCVNQTFSCFDDAGVMCNGHGVCLCNKCVCTGGYLGNLCQECVANCPDPCQDYRECVKCSVFDTSDLNPAECQSECDRWNITSYVTKEKVPEDQRCIVRDEDECSFFFTYIKDNATDAVKLIVQEERICPAEPDILAIILGVIAGIVGIGLALLLIWKLLATIQDRREFARFDKETKSAKWNTGENPIFKQATSTFQNPMYGNQPQEPTEE